MLLPPPRRSFPWPTAFTISALAHALGLAGLLLALPSGSTRAAAADAPAEITYGGDANFPPYEFLDPRGEPAGLNIELMRAIAREQGLTVRFRLLPWVQVREGLRRGTIDIGAMYRSARRAAEVDFAIPHELVYHEMFIRRGTPPLRALPDLYGRQILVEEGTFSEDALTELGYGSQLLRCASEPEALRRLAQGEGDVAVVTQTVGRPFESRQEYGSRIAATGPPVLLGEYAFVSGRGGRELLEVINDGVMKAKASGEYDRIYERWIRPGSVATRWFRWLAWGLGGAGALIVWFVLWNVALRRQVAGQTRALRREFEERERTQQALADNERKLRQAQKMEIIGRLTGSIAHDFNNILTAIMSYAGFLREEQVATNQSTADTDEILAAAERAARLTRQLLVFSRETPVETKRLDLVQIVRELTGMMQRLVGENIRLAVDVPDHPVVAEGDRTAIEQALLNLAANARDAMQGRGRLDLTVTCGRLAEGNPLQLTPGDYATITVTDTGCGMSPEILAHLAEPFFTTKEAGKGTGLGLASVYATVAKHGGKVRVRSEPGRGSSFELLLPGSKDTVADRESAPASAPPRPDGSGWTVLLVEDDDALRRAACLALKRCDFQVREAHDGQHALELAATGVEFQLVVTDVVMPRVNGPQMVSRLRAQRDRLHVLYVSGYVQKESGLDLNTPGTAFLAKPYTSDQLLTAVHGLITGNQTGSARSDPAGLEARPG